MRVFFTIIQTCFCPLFLSLICCCLVLSSCYNEAPFYKKNFSEKEKAQLPDHMTNNLLGKYYQGSISEIIVLKEALSYQPENAMLWRELGVPYGKRGIAAKYSELYSKAVEYDPLNWQGWRGYMYLYFYRDYKRALKDFNELDKLTPNFVDYPQSISIHFMRGICHMQLREYELAHAYWDKHMKHELSIDSDERFIDSKTYLFKAVCYYKEDNFTASKVWIERGLKYHAANSDLHYWSAKINYKLKDYKEAEKSIQLAKKYHELGNFNDRPYVEEFYQTYSIDISDFQSFLHRERPR